MNEKRVLLVDDDSICLSFMKELLADKHILKLAHSGEEALDLAQEFCPDLVVLDVMLPGLDGFEVSQSLRKIDPSGKTKIIFVSAKTPEIENRIDIDTHGYGFLLKPFGPDDFDNRVKEMLEA